MGTTLCQQQFFAALCKTRDKGTMYAAESKGCDKAQQSYACDTESAVADATDCKTFKTEDERNQFLAQNPKRSAVTCKVNATGSHYRSEAADCGNNSKNFECDPASTTQLECKDFGNDEAGLKKYLKESLIGAQVKCKLPSGQETELPSPDCSQSSQEAVCQKKEGLKGTPVSCKKMEG